MDWLRSAIGVAPTNNRSNSRPAPNATLERARAREGEKPHHERLASLVRAQSLQMQAMREEYADLGGHQDIMRANVQSAIARGDKQEAGRLLRESKKIELERAKLQAEMEMHEKKLANTRAQQQVLSTANANIEQALLMQSGAQELQSATQAMEEIDLAGAMDSIQDAAGLVRDHDQMLTEPILGGGVGQDTIDDDEVQEELRRLMDAHADEKLSGILGQAPPTRVSAAGTLVNPSVNPSVNSPTGQQEEQPLKSEK
jgi:hypothetical protein